MRLHIARFHSGNAPLRALLAALAAGPLMLGSASAGQLTYTPVNPSFGGNPLNGSYMLQSAQAQKRYQMPMDGLDLPDAMVLAQTDQGIVFQKKDANGNTHYYWFNTTTGVATEINLGDVPGITTTGLTSTQQSLGSVTAQSVLSGGKLDSGSIE
ncbi:curli assembly protein CsgF [Castellaniella caeni]|uniref:curli assembly protein CsgF n=1 Tax=Castellaniella caeni TaxID=266123 RepID=UPI001CA55443|nr:curli assembly protein CsgF [Castellaniella caeni]